MNLQRYEFEEDLNVQCSCGMARSDSGEYVLTSDVRSRIDLLEKVLSAAEDLCHLWGYDYRHTHPTFCHLFDAVIETRKVIDE